jgi:hypothetical protein
MIKAVTRSCAPLLLVPLLMAGPIAAQDGGPGVVIPPPGQSPPTAQPPVASPPAVDQSRGATPSKGQKSEPGMMGLAWPKSPEDAEKTVSDLLAHLATQSDPWLAGQIAVQIEKIWRLPGGDTVNLLIDRAHAATARNQLDLALKLLDAAGQLAPDFADVWNRRAYVHYRAENTKAALEDLRRALALDPNHFRALDGMAKILESIGEKPAALKAYDALLRVYPEIEGAAEAAAKLREEVLGKGI